MERYYPNKGAKLIIVGISIAILLCSFTQPAFYVQGNDSPEWPSGTAFFFGFFGPLSCISGISWLANPCLIFAWIRMRSAPKISAIAAFLALLLAIFFAVCKTIMVDEAGHMGAITGLGKGYYLWVASIAVCLLGSLVMYMADRRGDIMDIKGKK